MSITILPTSTSAIDDIPHGAIARWRRRLAKRLWPGRCLVCTAPGREGLDLCIACADSLPWQGPACLRCALPLNADEAPGSTCCACASHPPPLIQTHAACIYQAPLDRLVPRFKFHRDLAAGRLLSRLMIEAFVDLPRPDAIVPIPLHRSRLRQRGYDQALELARPLALALGVPLLTDTLVRTVATTPQSRLDAADRHYNLEDAFDIRPGTDLPAHLVLVDDVMTTGATLHSAAATLYLAGAVRVDAWVTARAP